MFKKVTEIAPDNSRGWSNLGRHFISIQGDYTKSIEASNNTQLPCRPNLDAYSNLG